MKALTAIRDVALITVGGPGIVGLHRRVARSFAATAALRTNVLFVSQSSSQNDICFVIPRPTRSAPVASIAEGVRAGNRLRRPGGTRVPPTSDIAVVAVVGENMRGIPGVAGRTFAALGRESWNIIAIAQGSSEYNISLVVQKDAMQRALVALHSEFRLHESAPVANKTPSLAGKS